MQKAWKKNCKTFHFNWWLKQNKHDSTQPDRRANKFGLILYFQTLCFERRIQVLSPEFDTKITWIFQNNARNFKGCFTSYDFIL